MGNDEKLSPPSPTPTPSVKKGLGDFGKRYEKGAPAPRKPAK